MPTIADKLRVSVQAAKAVFKQNKRVEDLKREAELQLQREAAQGSSNTNGDTEPED